MNVYLLVCFGELGLNKMRTHDEDVWCNKCVRAVTGFILGASGEETREDSMRVGRVHGVCHAVVFTATI